jgi:hypothetical protein
LHGDAVTAVSCSPFSRSPNTNIPFFRRQITSTWCGVVQTNFNHSLTHSTGLASASCMLTFRRQEKYYRLCLSAGIKRPGRESDRSPPSGAEGENAWSYTSTTPCVFMAWCLIKHRTRLHDVVLS